MTSDSAWSVALLLAFELAFIALLLLRGRRRAPDKPLVHDVYRLAGRARR